MSRLPLLVLLPFCAMFAAPPALAIYRCESAGKTVYSDAPCAKGAQQREVDTSDAVVNPVNAQQARVRAERERASLEKLTEDRDKVQREADKRDATAREQKAQADAKKRDRCEQLADDKRRADDEFKAAPPGQQFKAQLAASRADEKYRKACAAP